MELRKKLPYIIQDKLPLGSEAADVYYQMISVSHTTGNSVVLGNNCSGIGPVNRVSSLSDSMHQTALYTVTISKNLGIFKRILLNNSAVHSRLHTQPKKRNTYTVSYLHNSDHCHGEVLYFVTDYTETYAIVVSFTNPIKLFPGDEITNCGVPHIHVYSCKSGSSVHAIEVSAIKLCVSIVFEELPSMYFIAEQPNTYEKDQAHQLAHSYSFVTIYVIVIIIMLYVLI